MNTYKEQEITIRWQDGTEYNVIVASGNRFDKEGYLLTKVDDRIFYWLDDSELPLSVGQVIAGEAEVVAN
jgi:hypothetical protein